MTSTPTDRKAVEASHPAFCEGGIACEKTQTLPADWTHEGRLTQFHTVDQRIGLELVRYDGQGGDGGYQRGPVQVRLTLTETASLDHDGNEISVSVEMNGVAVDTLLSFLADYGAQQDAYRAGHGITAYEMPNEELPKRGGMTKAQEVWNAIDFGHEIERIDGQGGGQHAQSRRWPILQVCAMRTVVSGYRRTRPVSWERIAVSRKSGLSTDSDGVAHDNRHCSSCNYVPADSHRR